MLLGTHAWVFRGKNLDLRRVRMILIRASFHGLPNQASMLHSPTLPSLLNPGEVSFRGSYPGSTNVASSMHLAGLKRLIDLRQTGIS